MLFHCCLTCHQYTSPVELPITCSPVLHSATDSLKLKRKWITKPNKIVGLPGCIPALPLMTWASLYCALWNKDVAPTYVIYGHCVTMQWHNPWYAEEGKKLLFCMSVCVGTPEEFLDRVGFVTLCNVLIYFVCVYVYVLCCCYLGEALIL